VRALAVTGPSAPTIFPDLADRRRNRPARITRRCCTRDRRAGRTPKPIIDKLAGRVCASHRSSDVPTAQSRDGAEVMGMTPGRNTRPISTRGNQVVDIVRRSGAKAQ